jgi:hypothetical protein
MPFFYETEKLQDEVKDMEEPRASGAHHGVTHHASGAMGWFLPLDDRSTLIQWLHLQFDLRQTICTFERRCYEAKHKNRDKRSPLEKIGGRTLLESPPIGLSPPLLPHH